MVERLSSEIVIKRGVSSPVLTVPITPESKRRFYLMQEDYIELKFNLLETVEFRIGDYIEDELFGKFVITEKQFPTFNEANGCYAYSLRFDAEYLAWENKIFMLTTLDGNNARFRKEVSWILTDTLENHVKEVLNNLSVLGITYGNAAYGYDIAQTATHAGEARSISYDGAGIISALNSMAQAFETEWWVRDGIIHFGKCENGAEALFSLENGQTEANMVAVTPQRNEDTYANRVYFFGGTQNIPDTYGKTLVFGVTQTTTKDSKTLFRDGTRIVTPDMLMGSGASVTQRLPSTHFFADGLALVNETTMLSIPRKGTYKVSTPYLPVEFYVRWTSVQGFALPLLANYTISAQISGPVNATLFTWSGVVHNTFNYNTDDEHDRRAFVSEAFQASSQTLDLEAGTYTFSLRIEATLPGEIEDVVCSAVDGDLIGNEGWIEAVLTSTYVDCPLTYNGTSYTVRFNPFVSASNQTDYTYFYFVSNGAYTAPPSGFGIGKEYTLGISDGTGAGLDISKVPVSFWRTDYSDPSSLMKIGENRLHLPTGTCPYGYLDSPNASGDVVEKSVILDYIYPKCILKVASVATTERKDTTENSDGSDTYWNWIQYTLTATQKNGNPFPFKKTYVKSGVTLQARFLTPDDAGMQPSAGHYTLAGMTFDVLFGTDANGNPTYTLKRNDNYGAKLPNDVLKPAVGDPFVLLGWDVAAISALGLVDAAESELYDVAQAYMAALEDDNFIFRCRMFSTSMYALPSMYNYGHKVEVKYGSVDKHSRILGYTFKLDMPWDTPEYEIGETDVYSRLKQLEKKMSQGGGAVGTTIVEGSGGGSSSSSQSVDLDGYLTIKEADETYMRKDGVPSSVPWSIVTGKPNSLSGYGIEDAYTKAEADAKFANFFELDGNGGVKLKDQYNGLWAAGWISAGGRSETSGGGGGGGSDLNSLRSWSAYNASDEGQVLGSNLGKDMYDRIVALENSATSVSFTPAYSLGTSLGTITIDNVSQTIKAGVQILDVADSGSTTAGTWLASNSDITALTDGLTIRYKVTVAGASTTKLNLNGLGAKTVYRNGTTKLTTQYPVGSYILLYYSTSLNSGSWLAYSDYDANSYAYQTRMGTNAKFIVTGATSSGFLKGDGSIDTNTYLTGNQTITLSGDVSGSGTTSIAVTIGAGKVTNSMLAGSIANNKLANSSLTVGGATISLGGSATLTQIGVPAWAQASSLAFASLPAMYIGSTAVKSDNTAAGIIGITSINATSSTNHASRIVWDSTNGAWHFYGNIYADGWISAGGRSETSGGGGGSDVTVLRSWPANPSDQYEALGSNLGQGLKNSVDGLDTRVTALEQSATSVEVTDLLSDGTTVATIIIDSTDRYVIKAPIPDMSGYVPTTRTVNGKSLATNVTLSKSDLGLGNVENTAISTWTGSNYLSTLGTITTGTWNGTPIANTYLEHASVGVGSATIQLGGSATLTELGIPSWAQESTPDLLIGILDDEFHPKGGRGTLDFSARDLSAVGMLTVGTGGTGNAKIYFNSLNNKLELVNIGTEQSPRYALHSTMPIYSDDFISAGGRSDTTEGSGGGGGVPHVLLSESEWESIQTAGTVDPGTIYLVYENVEEETT